MRARWKIGAMISAVLLGSAIFAFPPLAAVAAEPTPMTPLMTCSDPDSFGSAADVGDNQLTLEKIGALAPAYRLVARWSRWDGQDLAASAQRDLGRAIAWDNPRLVLRLREESAGGVTLLTQEQVMESATFSGADGSAGALATVDIEPALLWSKSGGSVYVKVRVERPGLDLATCWARVPSTPTLDGAARSSGALDFAATP